MSRWIICRLNLMRVELWLVTALVLCFPTCCASAREVPITIMHTCDLHGNVLPTENYEGRTNLGGIARCATMIRQIRAATTNCLLVDAGDTIQGAAISYLSDGRVMVKLLNYLRYDAWVWGNHEFDWGLEKLAACAERAEMPILNANVRASESNSAVPVVARRIVSVIKPYLIKDVDGVKIAIIGLNTPGIPNWSRPRLIGGLEFEDSIEALRRIIPAVREAGAKVIVLVCHQGYRESGDDHANQVNAIARNFPELDLIIGGHTHRNFPEFKVANILYSQADYFGIHLGRVDLVFDTETGRVSRRRSNTLLMDDHVPLDANLTKLVGAEIEHTEKLMGTVIGEATGEFHLHGAPKQETPIHNLIFDAVDNALRKHGVRVDAMMHGVLEKRGTLARGSITLRDVWRLIPYENTIGVAELFPSDLRAILEENLTAYQSGTFRGLGGLKWTFDWRAEPNARLVSLRHRDGSPLDERKPLLVAFNSYELASGGLRWTKLREIVDRPESHLKEFDFQTRQAVIDYIHDHRSISPTLRGWWAVQRAAKN